MQAALAAATWVAAGVLAWAGWAKVVRPAGTRAALLLAGLPAGRMSAASLGVVEIAIGLTALVIGGRWAAPLAAAYAALAVFSHRQRGRPAATCGCFGDAEAPLTRAHVMLNGAAALAAGATAVVGAPGVAAATSGRPGVLIAALVATATATSAVVQFLTTVPTLAAHLSPTRRAGA